MKFEPKHLKSFWNKKNILLVSLCLLLVIGVGGTLAWLTGYDGSVEYPFEGAFVDCSVDEQFDGTTKSNVRIQNTGTVDAYFRATYTINWVKDGTEDDETPEVYRIAPKEGQDYTVSINTAEWYGMYDGYWYRFSYPSFLSVKAGEYSPVFIQTLTDNGTAPEGYHLQVNILAEAIQSTNDDAEPAFMDTWWKTYGQSQSRPEKVQ